MIIAGLLAHWLIIPLGCASIKDGVKGFLAISTKEIENARDKAIVRIIDRDYISCYRLAQVRLSEIGSYIYARKKDLLAVYISQTDTTPAGIFFRQIDAQKTEVSIASPAADTKEFLAEKIFSALITQ